MSRGLDASPEAPVEPTDPADLNDDAAPDATSPLGRHVVGMLTLICAALVVAALHFGVDILMPLALALLLAFVLDPLVLRLCRWRWPRALAVAVVLVFTGALLAGTSAFVGSQLVQLGRDLPTYQSTIQKKLRTLRQSLVARRPFGDASRVIGVVEGEFDAARRALARPQPSASTPTRVQVEPAPLSPLRTLAELVGPVLKPVGTAGIVIVFVIFVLLGRNDLRDRALRLVGGDLHRTTDAMNEAAQRVSRYLTMQLLVNMGYGVPLALGLWWIGVPGALLWGVLATVLRFVPYVGSIICAVFPLTLAFAVDPGWSMFLWTAGLVLALELTINNLAEPYLYGNSTGLGPMAVLVSAAFWTVLWGPVGLVLATPLTVCLVSLGRHLPQLRFLDVLLGNEPVFDTPTRLYQRLLAGDVEEAIEIAETQVQAESLPHFYADTALPALWLAAQDRQRFEPEHRRRITRGMSALIRDLHDALPGPPTIGEPVLCIGLRSDSDALAARMLAHALQSLAVPAQALPPALVSAERIGRLDLGGTHTVVLACLHPRPEVVARYVCRRLRRLRPGLQIVLALWSGPDAGPSEDSAQALGADRVVVGFDEALGQLLPPVHAPPAPGAAASPPVAMADDRAAAGSGSAGTPPMLTRAQQGRASIA